MLGPDCITDDIVVETSDHARLSVRYAVNNYFKVRTLECGTFTHPYHDPLG